MDNTEKTKTDEFKALGITIEKLSIFYGIFLIVWGVIISFLSDSNSFTSYIPSLLGVPILIFSFLSIIFVNKKKMFMHIVVFFGLVIFLGGLDFIRIIIGGSIFENYWADISKLMMMLTGLFFTIQCIRSFIHARKIKNLNN
tara:strand:+ start:478 stop:903 length:426 start_codon:yes stop_codon:yes gene_type:complete